MVRPVVEADGPNRTIPRTVAHSKSVAIPRIDPLFCEREDWKDFLTIEGLRRRAGTDKLGQVCVKEIVDNALDVAGDCDLDISDGVVIVHDRGSGIEGDDEEIAEYFSFNRQRISSNFDRRLTRGRLGNGLRAVVGAVVATAGTLFISTFGRRLQIITDPNTGKSKAIRAGHFDGPGTRIEIELGSPFELTSEDMILGEIAIAAARAQVKKFARKSSPHWFGPDTFHHLAKSIK